MIVPIQYLRALAAMMVVAFHACDILARMPNANPMVQFAVGPAGVDVFFVISGFIMWVIAERTDPTPTDFIRRRIIRIVPLYWVLTLVLAAVAIVKPTLLSTAVFEPQHFMASLLFFPWPHPNLGTLSPLVIPGWTLNYEMAFYAIFALCLFLPRAKRMGYLLAVMVALVSVGLLVEKGGAAAFYTDPIILEFACGAIIGYLYVRGVRLQTSMSLFMVLTGCVLLYMGVGSTLPRAISWGIPACLIVAGIVMRTRAKNAQPIRPLVAIGDASYSIYLSHGFAFAALAKLWSSAGLEGGGVQGFAFLAVAISGAVVGGMLLYLLLERPMQNWLSRDTRRPAVTGGRVAANLLNNLPLARWLGQLAKHDGYVG